MVGSPPKRVLQQNMPRGPLASYGPYAHMPPFDPRMGPAYPYPYPPPPPHGRYAPYPPPYPYATHAAAKPAVAHARPAVKKPLPAKVTSKAPSAPKAGSSKAGPSKAPARSARARSDEAAALEKEFFSDKSTDNDSDVEETTKVSDDETCYETDKDDKAKTISLHVTCIKQVPSGRNGKTKAESSARTITLDVNDAVDRMKLGTTALTAHRLQHKYQTLPDTAQGGFPYKAHYQGSPGGKAGAVTIMEDSDFDRLWSSFTASGKQLLYVSFELAGMERYVKLNADASPAISAPGTSSTGAPAVSQDAGKYAPQDRTIQSAMKMIEDRWGCKKKTHTGVCVPDPEHPDQCRRFNIPMVKVWGLGYLDGKFTLDTPPEELLQSAPSVKQPRSQRGSQQDEPRLSSQDLLTALVLGMRQPQPPAAPPAAPPVARPPSPQLRSSSPPAPDDDELFIALAAFGKKRKLAGDQITHAYQQFRAVGYAPDSFDGTTVTLDRVQQLSGFNEGTASALMIYCKKWSDRMEAKRERRKRRRLE